MKITIIAVGKIKEKYLVDGIKEYSKRLSAYTKLEIIEIPDEKAPENLSPKDYEQIKTKEGLSISSRMPNGYTVACSIDGNNLSSEELADKIQSIFTYNDSNITLIIGGSIGLSDEILQKADFKLSFGRNTFPHQLMRLILLEQLYRSFRIMRNEPYHK